jgi:hypothetical protein
VLSLMPYLGTGSAVCLTFTTNSFKVSGPLLIAEVKTTLTIPEPDASLPS